MKDFQGIIQNLKEYKAKDRKKKVLDKDIAEMLEMSQSKFATIKKRNSTPYESILRFCKKEELCCREIFFD